MRSFFVKPIIATLCISVLTACSILNPHERWERMEGHDAGGAIVGLGETPTVRQGILYAHRAENDLNRKIGDQSKLRNGVAVAELLLAGALGGWALTGDVPSSAVISMSMAGVTGLALATWFDSTPRQRTWLLGIKGLICSVDAVLPFETLNVLALDGHLAALNEAISAAEAGQAKVNAILQFMSAAGRAETVLTLHAKSEVAVAQSSLADAKRAIDTGALLAQKARQAGPQLENTVDRIGYMVSSEIIETEPQLERLRDMISGLAFSAPDFVRIPDASAFKIPIETQSEAKEKDNDNDTLNAIDREARDLNAALTALGAALADMNAHSRAILSDVRALDEGRSLAALKSDCGIDIKDAIQPLTTDPSGEIQFIAGVGGTTGFTVRGGNSQYAGRMLGSPAGITFSQAQPFSPYFDVNVTTKAVAGTYRLSVKDVTGAEVLVAITVLPKAVESPIEPGVEASVKPQAEDPLIKDAQQALQKLGFDPKSTDGVRGDNTNAAIQGFLDTIGFAKKPAESLDLAAFSAVFSALTASLTSTTSNPEGLRVVALERLLKQAGHDPGPINGVVDDRSRAAAKAFNKDTVLPMDTAAEQATALKLLRDADVYLDEERAL